MSVISRLPHGGGNGEIHGAHINCTTETISDGTEATLSLGGVIVQAKRFANGVVVFDNIQTVGIYTVACVVSGETYNTNAEITATDIVSGMDVNVELNTIRYLYRDGDECVSITGGWNTTNTTIWHDDAYQWSRFVYTSNSLRLNNKRIWVQCMVSGSQTSRQFYYLVGKANNNSSYNDMYIYPRVQSPDWLANGQYTHSFLLSSNSFDGRLAVGISTQDVDHESGSVTKNTDRLTIITRPYNLLAQLDIYKIWITDN